jgi:3-hydroxyisobutyrate dehydrogenase
MSTITFIGLGRMGGPTAADLVKAGHDIVGFDVVLAAKEAANAGGIGVAAGVDA